MKMLLGFSTGIAVFLSVILILPTSNAFAFGQKSDICGSWNNYCRGGSNGGGYSGGGGGLRWGSTPQEQNAKLYKQGLAAWDAENYAEAVRLFEEALDASYDPVTELMLLRSRRELAFRTGKAAYDKGDYVRAFRFLRDALRLARVEYDRKPTDSAATRIKNLEDWVAEAEPLASRKADDARWESAIQDSRGRVAAVLDDLSDRISASADFAAPATPVEDGGALTFMAPGAAPEPESAPHAAPADAGRAQTTPGSAAVPVISTPLPQKGIKFKPVPPPTPKAISDAWVRMNAQTPPDMILEALKHGKGDLAASVLYMRKRITLNLEDREAREALSYLEALRDAEKTYQTTQLKGDSRHLLNAIQTDTELKLEEESGVDTGMGAWRAARNFAVRRALDAAGGDVDAALRSLTRSGGGLEADTRDAAVRYLQGLNAYRDWNATKEEKAR